MSNSQIDIINIFSSVFKLIPFVLLCCGICIFLLICSYFKIAEKYSGYKTSHYFEMRHEQGKVKNTCCLCFLVIVLLFSFYGCAYTGIPIKETKTIYYDILTGSNYLKLTGKISYSSSIFGGSRAMVELEEKDKFTFYYEENGVVKHKEIDNDFPIILDPENKSYMKAVITYTKQTRLMNDELEVVDTKTEYELHLPENYFEDKNVDLLNY